MVQRSRNYILRRDKARAQRAARIRRRAGKDLLFDEAEMLELLAANKVPTMMQHCVLKVSKKMDGTDKEKYISAFNICTACFQRNGYMRRGSMTKTGKGTKRNRMHQREKESGQKKNRFQALTRRLWGADIRDVKQEKKKSN